MRSEVVIHWKEFGRYLREQRIAHGFTLRGLARDIPVVHSYLGNVEQGIVRPPSVRIIVRVAELLEVPPTPLLAKAGKLHPSTLHALWTHPALPPILSTLPGMSLEDAQTYCHLVAANVHS
jgi:transcriptional regulator with XRE-family HTH domain